MSRGRAVVEAIRSAVVMTEPQAVHPNVACRRTRDASTPVQSWKIGRSIGLLLRQAGGRMTEFPDFVLLHSVSALVIVLDGHGRIEWWNRACEVLTGHSLELVRGLLFWDVLLITDPKKSRRSNSSSLGSVRATHRAGSKIAGARRPARSDG